MDKNILFSSYPFVWLLFWGQFIFIYIVEGNLFQYIKYSFEHKT